MEHTLEPRALTFLVTVTITFHWLDGGLRAKSDSRTTSRER
jgi:hypothetical protein